MDARIEALECEVAELRQLLQQMMSQWEIHGDLNLAIQNGGAVQLTVGDVEGDVNLAASPGVTAVTAHVGDVAGDVGVTLSGSTEQTVVNIDGDVGGDVMFGTGSASTIGTIAITASDVGGDVGVYAANPTTEMQLNLPDEGDDA